MARKMTLSGSSHNASNHWASDHRAADNRAYDKGERPSPRTIQIEPPFCALPEYYFERAASADHSARASQRFDVCDSERHNFPQRPNDLPQKAGLSLERWSSPTTFGK